MSGYPSTTSASSSPSEETPDTDRLPTEMIHHGVTETAQIRADSLKLPHGRRKQR
jgi:hypothetical protein